VASEVGIYDYFGLNQVFFSQVDSKPSSGREIQLYVTARFLFAGESTFVKLVQGADETHK
jgi:hypothetical protein